jgi:hypothetical protein
MPAEIGWLVAHARQGIETHPSRALMGRTEAAKAGASPAAMELLDRKPVSLPRLDAGQILRLWLE